MKAFSFAELSWLERAPDDFRAQLAAVGADAPHELRRLAKMALNDTQLTLLAKNFRRAAANCADFSQLVPLPLGIISGATATLLSDPLCATGIRHGLALEISTAEYGQVAQTVLTPASKFRESKVAFVLLALDAESLPLGNGGSACEENAVERSLDYIDSLREGIRKNIGAVAIVQTLAVPPEPLFGNLDIAVSSSMRSISIEFNRGLVDRVKASGDLIFDVGAIAESVGTASWFDPVMRHLAKLPFAQQYVPLYAEHLCRLLAAQKGLSKRVLVLDLDNTLWGGVIGDDGIEGIILGQGSALGEAFLEVQRTALRLRERGVVLAVSSKNTDEVARLPFRAHPDMLLKEKHVSVFQANWQDKASNLKSIARELNLGTESLVLLDDNPAERHLVRRELPEVGVPELPEDPALFARTLLAAGYFETVSYSSEDFDRARYYEENARRAELQVKFGDAADYLQSLDMVLGISRFDFAGRSRIVQLINKTNQFNLTTNRYTSADIERIESDSAYCCLQARLRDRFGDNGMISVVICRSTESREWEIDTWLMSCRVLGRCVERAILEEISALAKRSDVTRLVGIYRPSRRNKLVEGHYRDLGFSECDPPAHAKAGDTYWVLDLENWQAHDSFPMKIEASL